MKSKLDFITNSSSSSFIISAEKDRTEFIYTLKVDLFKELNPTIIHNVQELEKEFEGYEDHELEEMKKELEEGKHIYIFRYSNDGEAIEQFFYDEGINIKNIENKTDITVLQSEY